MPTTADPRLEFFEMEATPAPPPRPAPVDEGPAQFHRLHGAIRLERAELRVTTQGNRGPDHGARIVVRMWHSKPDGTWWTDSKRPGVYVPARDARAFLKAVAAAVTALEADGRTRTTAGGAPSDNRPIGPLSEHAT